MINLIDIIIIVSIIMTGILGFKRGVFKELIKFLGVILVIVVSYKLKDYIGNFLLLNFPFMDFPNFLRGAIALNIVMYQSIAFILTSSILFLIYDFLVSITGIFEKILRWTIILGIPSKILGFFVGLIEGYVIAYIIILFLAQPALNFEMVNESKYADKILYNTPILTNMAKDTINLTKRISELSKINNVNEMNLSLVDLMLEKKVVSVEIIEKLVDKGKLNVKNIDIVINKYREEK